MKTIIISRLLYFCLAVLLVINIGCNEKDINGKWKGEMETPNGPFELTYDFLVTGDSLSGTASSPMGSLPISSGKSNGDSFSFDVDVNGMIINSQCTFMSDSILMKVEGIMQGPMEMVLKRVPEPTAEAK